MQQQQKPLQFKAEARRPAKCKCGGNAFLDVRRMFFVPGVANDRGEDVIIAEPALYCVSCKSLYSSPQELDIRRI